MGHVYHPNMPLSHVAFYVVECLSAQHAPPPPLHRFLHKVEGGGGYFIFLTFFN